MMKANPTQSNVLTEFTIYTIAHEIYQAKKRIKLDDLILEVKGTCLDIVAKSNCLNEDIKLVLAVCDSIRKEWRIVRQYLRNETFDRADLTAIHRGIEIDEMNRHYKNRFETHPKRLQEAVVRKFNELKLLTDDILLIDFQMLVKEGGTAVLHKSRDNNRLFAFFMALSELGLIHYGWQSAICKKGYLLSPLGQPIRRSNVNSACSNIRKMANNKHREFRDELISYFLRQIIGQ